MIYVYAHIYIYNQRKRDLKLRQSEEGGLGKGIWVGLNEEKGKRKVL